MTQQQGKREHTPGPWRSKVFADRVQIYGADDIHVVDTSWHSHIRKVYPLKDESLANANFIVHAVNSHNDLVAALEASRDTLAALLDVLRKEPSMQRREYVDLGIQCTDTAKKIEAALAESRP